MPADPSPAHPLRLYRRERLCSQTAIDALWTGHDVQAAVAYPLRAVWKKAESQEPRAESGWAGTQAGYSIVISVPKRRLRHAVDRVLMRRRIREAFRLHRLQHPVPHELGPVNVALVYVADRLTSYAQVEKGLLRLLNKICAPQP